MFKKLFIPSDDSDLTHMALLLTVGLMTRLAAALLVIAGGGLFSLDTLVFGKSARSRLQQKV